MRLTVIILVLTVLLFAFSANAALLPSNYLGGSFGRRIKSIVICTCSFSLKITVGEPKGGTFIYFPFTSRLYRNYSPVTGRYVLGTSIGRAPCLQIAGSSCVIQGYGSVIMKMGT